MIVSIIICTCNRAEHLRETLASMSGVCVPEEMPTELIVVDNGSTDGTVEVVKQCHLLNMNVRYIYEVRQGQCYARNAGIEAALGEVILFTDDDVRPPKNWIAGMCEIIFAGKTDAVTGGVQLASHLERDWMSQKHRDWLASTDNINPNKPNRMVGANMAFSRRVLDRVPQFDTELGPGALGFYDETLFAWQLQKVGFRLESALDINVEHHFDENRLSRKNFIISAKKMGRSKAYVQHHWIHDTLTPGRAKRNLFSGSVKLVLRRLQGLRNRVLQNSPQEWDLKMVEELAYYQQYLIEYERPRNYEKQGLIKISL